MSVTGKVQQVTDVRQAALGDTPARRRIGLLLDTDSFVELDGLAKAGGKPAGVVCGYGAIMGSPVAVFAQDSTEQSGAVGAVHAAKIGKVYDLALKTGVPVVGIYDSYGAKLDEGIAALAAYGDMLRQANTLSGVVPQISVVLGTCAGASAMMACSADFLIMSEKAELFMAAPNSDEAGKAAAAAKSGVAHIVSGDDATACAAARRLLALLPINNLAAATVSEFSEPGGEDRLRAACENMASASGEDIVYSVVDANSAIELFSEFGKNVYTALATMGGSPCGIVAVTGGLCTNCCDKIAKLVSVCDAFQLPVLTFVNTEGLNCVGEGDLCDSIRDMARMAHVYAEATTAKIAVITGTAYGSAYIALAGRAAGSDYTVAWPSAIISPLSPETTVALLHGDDITPENPRAAVEAAYIEKEASAFVAAAGGYIDDVIDPAVTRPALLSALDLLSAKRVSTQPKKHSNLPL